MDFTRFAKWGIHVKEEPDFLDTPQLKEVDENNVLDSNRAWMCKFPCDAQATFNVSIADSIPSGLQEPIEASLPSYSVNYPEPLDIHSPVISREYEESVNLGSVSQHCTIVDEDKSGKTNLEENISRRLLNVYDADKKEELFSNEGAAVPQDASQKGVICYNFGKMQKNVFHFESDSKQDQCGKVDDDVENQRKLLQNSSLELIDNDPQNINAVKNAEKEIDIFSNPEKLNLPEGIYSLIKDLVTETDQQKKRQNEKSPIKSDHLGFKCPDCDKIIKRSSGFITHMKLHGMNEESEPIFIKCKNCKQLFKDKKSLSRHKNICKSSRRSSLNSFCSNKNGEVCVPVRLLGENICENHQLESLQKSSKESLSLKENTHQKADDLLQQSVDVPENNFKQQRKIQISGRKSPVDKSKLSSNPKKRRLSQSFTECNLENPGVQGHEKSCHTVQNNGQGCKSIDEEYQESWFSEIKSNKDEKIPNSKSIILSLRRFRFQKPKVLVERIEIPNHIENNTGTKSVTSSDTSSNSLIRTQTHFQGDNLAYSSSDSEYALNHIMNEPETVSDSDTDRILNLVSDSNTLVSPKKCVSSADGFCTVSCSRSLDREICYTKTNSSDILNEQSLKGEDIGNGVQTFRKESRKVGNSSPDSIAFHSPFIKLTKLDITQGTLRDEVNSKCTSRLSKDSKMCSDLKIKIKPVVVLNRIGLLEYVNQESTSAQEIPKNVIKKTETSPKDYGKTTNNIHSKQSENCDVPSLKSSSEKLLCSEISSKDLSQSDDVLVSLAENLKNRDYCSKIKNKHGIENVTQSITKKLLLHNTTHSLIDGDYRKKCLSDSDNLFEALEKQYDLKKCYVKLERINVGNGVVKSDKTFNQNTETISELRTCEKLKLHRTNSVSWEVSSVKSSHLQNNIHVGETADVDFKELKEINRKKKYQHAYSSKILRESSGISGKNRNLALKVNHLKSFRVRCSWCHKLFYNQEKFGEHLKKHFVGYKCPNCSAKFHFWMELQTHLSGCSLASLLNCRNN